MVLVDLPPEESCLSNMYKLGMFQQNLFLSECWFYRRGNSVEYPGQIGICCMSTESLTSDRPIGQSTESNSVFNMFESPVLM